SSEYVFSKPQVSRKTLYKYNNSNNLIQVLFFDIYDSITNNINFEYDEKNNRVQILTNSIEEPYNYKIIFNYNEKNNLIEELYYGDSTFVYKGKKNIKYTKSKITESYNYNSKDKLT